MKAIVATEIRAGDTVRVREKCILTVKVAELMDTFGYEYHPKVRIETPDREVMEVDADSIVGLVHRPWPEGKTDRKWREELETLLANTLSAVSEDNWGQSGPGYGRSDGYLAALLESLQANELGRDPK